MRINTFSSAIRRVFNVLNLIIIDECNYLTRIYVLNFDLVCFKVFGVERTCQILLINLRDNRICFLDSIISLLDLFWQVIMHLPNLII